MKSSYSPGNVIKYSAHSGLQGTIKQQPSQYSIDDKQNAHRKSSFERNRSMSSTFRNSIRHLTSCASARRKTGRNLNQNKNNLPIPDSNNELENEQQNLIKNNSYSIQKTLPSFSSYQRQNTQPNDLSSTNDSQDFPPALPPRKPLDKKNSSQSFFKTHALNNNPIQTSSPNTNESSTNLLGPGRILPSKEISTSLVNLMGTATESVTSNNGTLNSHLENRPRKHSVFSFFQRISTAPSVTVDRLGLLDVQSNAGATSSLLDSPSTQRTVVSGHSTTIPNSTSTMKVTNDFSWCHESSRTDKFEDTVSCEDPQLQLEIDETPLIYRKQFEPTEHFNWYGVSESHGPIIISYKYLNEQEKLKTIFSICRTRQNTTIETLSDVHPSSTPIEILRRLCDQCSIADVEYFDPVLCDGTRDLILKFDESHVSNQHKFGIIYQRENQKTEEDIFSNETTNVAMENFLDLIGQRVKLKDFRKFRGGLDVKSDQTGTESVYEQFQDHEIMFHVSTLLPYSKSERQQLERKRHIGNDIVTIVFQETETPFNPECIASQFLHVYLVVTPLDEQGTQFKVSVIQRDTVPSFGPIRNDSSKPFHCDNYFKEWILTKLINAEQAACRASSIQKYQQRTRMTLFENLYRTLHEQNRRWMNFIFTHSQYKRECDLEQQQQQREEVQNYPSIKSAERHTDNSLLGSVRRRLIAPKLRVQNSHADHEKPSRTGALIAPSNNTGTNHNDSRSKIRSMTMELRRSVSRESIVTNGHTNSTNGNGRMMPFFSSSKTSSPRIDKTATNRSMVDQDSIETSISSLRTTTKFLSPATCPSSPWTSGPSNGVLGSIFSNDANQNWDSYSTSGINSSFQSNGKSLSDDTDQDSHPQRSMEDLQSSSKEELIKYVMTLQQKQQLRLFQMDSAQMKAMKRLEFQPLQQQHAVDRDSP